MHKDKSELLFALAVSALAFLVYANSLGNGFTLDDNSVIVNNPVLNGGVLSLFRSIDTTGDGALLPFYRPFTYLTFWIEGRLHGCDPFLIRLLNVLLHSFNSFLVYRLARSQFGVNRYPALLVGLLFAVHPLHSEGVDFNAGGRNTMLATLFSISAYLLHRGSVSRDRLRWAVAGAALFVAGLFSKESAFMVLPLIAGAEIAALRRKESRSGACLRLVPYLAGAACYLVLRWLTLSRLGIQTGILPGTRSQLIQTLYATADLGTRLAANLYVIPRYLLTVIWPGALCSRYTIPEDLNLLALPLFASWLAIICALAWLLTKGRSRITLFGLLWMTLFWLPVSGLFYFPGAPLADRFLYLPAIGLWIVVADQLARFLPSQGPPPRRYLLPALTVLLLLATVTVRRNLDWKDNLSLYSRFAEQDPDNIYARIGLGKAYYDSRKPENVELAAREFGRVIAMDPFFPTAHTLLGNIELNAGDLAGALYDYDQAVSILPNDKEARINRAQTYERLGRLREAAAEYQLFLTLPGANNLPGSRDYAQQRLLELSR